MGMSKKPDKKKMSLEEFVERVKKYLKIIVQEIKNQKDRLEKIEKKVETLKADVDTIKAKISIIERQAMPGIPALSQPKIAETKRVELPTEIPTLEELTIEEKSIEFAPAPTTTRAETGIITEQREPVAPEKKASEDFDLEKYLERLEQLGNIEKLGVSEVPPVEELGVPEVSPEGEESKPVSSEELKKKEKDLLKALSELEFA